MKNVINYFYGIIIDEYKHRGNNFSFIYNVFQYEFVEFYDDINKLFNIYSTLKSYNIFTDEIILNNKNEFITYYENKPYILIKKNNYNRNIDLNLNTILDYDNKIHTKKNIDWKNLWAQKIDYYSMQLEEIGIKYPKLKKSFPYYLGLSELAISLLNYVNIDSVNCSISHKRIENINDIYNPLNIIFDNHTRDVAEFVKINFFKSTINDIDVFSIFKQYYFTNDEIILLLSRLIYPSYYFDLYEKIYKFPEKESELESIIKKNFSYEIFLKKIYQHVKNKYSIPQIEFLETNQYL